jgi:acetylornithine deacetylase/succinyl-diaminopimelate desuccinylase-like protein
MNRAVSAIERWIPKYQEKFAYKGVRPTVNVGSIEGGWPWRASRTPGFCNLYVDVRFPPPYHFLDVKQELAGALQELKDQEGVSPELDLYLTDPWSQIDEGEYICESVDRAHQQIFGKPVERVYFSWSSDANILTRHGIAALNYGPSGGPGREVRGTMFIPNLVACSKVYSLVAEDIASKTREQVKKKTKKG